MNETATSDPTGDVPATGGLSAAQEAAIDVVEVSLRTDRSTNRFSFLPGVPEDQPYDHRMTINFSGSLTDLSDSTTWSGTAELGTNDAGNTVVRETVVYIDADSDRSTGADSEAILPEARGAEYKIRNGFIKEWYDGGWLTIKEVARREGAGLLRLQELSGLTEYSFDEHGNFTVKIDYDGTPGEAPFNASKARIVGVALAYDSTFEEGQTLMQTDATNTTIEEYLRTRLKEVGTTEPYPPDFESTVDGFVSDIENEPGVESVEERNYTDAELDMATVLKLWGIDIFTMAWNAAGVVKDIATFSPSDADPGTFAEVVESRSVSDFVFGDAADETIKDVARVARTIDKYGHVRVLLANLSITDAGHRVYFVVEKARFDRTTGWEPVDGHFENITAAEFAPGELPEGVDTPQRDEEPQATPAVSLSAPSEVAHDSRMNVSVTYTNENGATNASYADGVHLRIENGTFLSAEKGGFGEARPINESDEKRDEVDGARIMELYLTGSQPAGASNTSGDIAVMPEDGAQQMTIKYRAWSFDDNATNRLGNVPIGRDPADTPLNKHVIDESYTYLDYAVYNETIEVSPASPSTTITETNVSDASPGIMHVEWNGSDPDGSVGQYQYRVDGTEWVSVENTTLDLNLSRGSHTIGVRAIDATGRIGSAVSTTAALGDAVANFTVSQAEPLVGEQVTFDATDSSTPASSVIEYAWDFDDDGSYETTGETVDTTFPKVTDRTVGLRITDSRNVTATARTTISTDTTLVVANESGGDYRTIRAAIDRIPNNSAAKEPSYTIRVREGTYRETVTLDANVTLRAVGEAVLNGSTLSKFETAITVPEGRSLAPTIDGFRLVNYQTGVSARDVSGDWIIRNTTVDAWTGVWATGASGDWQIIDSDFRNNRYEGVLADETTGNWQIESSRFTDNAGDGLAPDGAIIATKSTGDWVVTDSVIVNNSGQAGVHARDSSGAWTIRNSSIKDNDCVGVDGSETSGDWTIRSSTVANHTSRCLSRMRPIEIDARNATGGPDITHAKIAKAVPCGTACLIRTGLDARGARPAVNATMNWWNASSGPSGIDSGDGRWVRGNALVRPFYTDRDLSALSTTDPDPSVAPSVSELKVTVPETGTFVVTINATEPLAGINVSVSQNGSVESRVRRPAFVRTGTKPYTYAATLKRPTGNYTVGVHTVRDASWNVVRVGEARTVNMSGNIPPEAAFSGPNHLDVGETIRLFGGSSRDRDGAIETYHWEIENVTTLTGESVSYLPGFDSPGRYNITLTVTDDAGANDSVTKTVRVGPSSDFRVDAIDVPASVRHGTTFTVTATVSNRGYREEATQTVGFRLDTDRNGTLDPDEVRSSKEVTLSNGESRTVRLNVSAASFENDSYRSGVFTANDSSTAVIDVSRFETRVVFNDARVRYGATDLSIAYANVSEESYYVVVYERFTDGSLSHAIGFSDQLPSGAHEDITVDIGVDASVGDPLDSLTDNTTLVTRLHAVSSDGGIGGPITHDGVTITDSANITVPPPIVVANDSGGDYESIQAAVDTASSDDTVLVRPGTYQEEVEIEQSLLLVAPEGATIDGAGLSGGPLGDTTGITIDNDAAPVISGFTITGHTTGVSVVWSGSDGDWTIENSVITNNSEVGVGAESSNGNWTIRNSSITNNGGSVRWASGVDAGDSSGQWKIRYSSIVNNSAPGVDAERSKRGNATYNWWGQPDGPDADQCEGSVDCSHPLSSPPDTGVDTEQPDGSDIAPFAETESLARDQTTPDSLAGTFRLETPVAGNVSVELLRNGSGNYSVAITAPDDAENVTVYLQERAISASQDIENVTMYLDGKEHSFVHKESAVPSDSSWIAFNVPAFSTRTVTFEPDASTTCIADAVSGSDDDISLTEIQDAINWWAEGSPVPDTDGKTIRLSKIQSLINAWAEGATVSCSG